MRIAAVFVNYRTHELTAKAVDILLEAFSAVGSHHIVVVDNDSGDGSFENLKKSAAARGWGERVSVLAAERNGGYGYGLNFGVRTMLARPDPPDYIYAINTDAFAEAQSLHKLLAFIDQRPDVGMVGGVINGPDGEAQGAAFRFPGILSELERAARLGTVSNLLRDHIVSLKPPEVETEVDWLPGTSMLIRREVFDAGVFFDEEFFLYYEEVDFAKEMRRAGFRAYFVPGAPIVHVGSVSTGLADMKRRLPDYWFDSRHRYFMKHHGGPYAAACDVAWIVGHNLFLLKSLLKPNEVARPHLMRDFLRASARQLLGSTKRSPAAAGTPAAVSGASSSS